MKVNYRVCRTFEQVKKVVEYCKVTGYCSLDFETKAKGPKGHAVGEDSVPTGPAHIEDEPTMISLCFQPGGGYAIPLFHKESPFSRKEVNKILKYLGEQLIENINVTKVAWNLKFEYKWFFRYGYTFRGLCIDGMLLKFLLDEVPPNDLKSITANFLPKYEDYNDEVQKAVLKNRGWEFVPLNILMPYCVQDSNVTLQLSLFLEARVMKLGFYALFRNMCMMQVRVLAESEMTGWIVDREYLDETIKQEGRKIAINLKKLYKHPRITKVQKWRKNQHIKKLIKNTQAEIADIRKETPDKVKLIQAREEKISRYIAGELITKKERIGDFNFNSPQQLIDLLFLSPAGFNFKIVKYTKDKKTKRDTDSPSTDEEVLLKLKNKDKSGFIDSLLTHREWSKIYSTYLVGMRHQLSSNDTIHGEFWIHGTVTSRLSSKNPNLQNIPRTTSSSLVKNMFVPPPGHLIVEFDYGQAELRVVAELSGDAAMIEIFEKNYNIHVATAAKINNRFQDYDLIKGILSDPNHPEHLFWEKQKKRGKVLNFSILYLQSDKETAEQMGVSEKEAATFKADWFRSFPGIKRWMAKQEAFVRKHGYVKTMFGFKRRLPDIWSYERGFQNKAIRDAINAPIQGTSSGFCQFASIEIRERKLKGELLWTDNPKYQYQICTVHDSVEFYVQPQYLHNFVKEVSKLCLEPKTIDYFGFEMKKVKMKVSPEVGKTWGGLTEYNPWENYKKWVE